MFLTSFRLLLCMAVVIPNKFIRAANEGDFQSLRQQFSDFDSKLTQIDAKLERLEQRKFATTKLSSLIIPATDSKPMNWLSSWSRCTEMGAQPFVPKTLQDFEILKTVRFTIGGPMWIPASDVLQEGVLKWWDGQDASVSESLEWIDGIELKNNDEVANCVIYGSVKTAASVKPPSDVVVVAHPGIAPPVYSENDYIPAVHMFPCHTSRIGFNSEEFVYPMICVKLD